MALLDVNDAREVAKTIYSDLCGEVYETGSYWIFYPKGIAGVMTVGGGDPVAVSKEDGMPRILWYTEDETWDILDAKQPVSTGV